MSNVKTLKEKLVQEIGKLPGDRLGEVLDFVGYLLRQEEKARTIEPKSDLDPAQDPILKFIGGISHGALAKDIDNELYGDARGNCSRVSADEPTEKRSRDNVRSPQGTL